MVGSQGAFIFRRGEQTFVKQLLGTVKGAFIALHLQTGALDLCGLCITLFQKSFIVQSDQHVTFFHIVADIHQQGFDTAAGFGDDGDLFRRTDVAGCCDAQLDRTSFDFLNAFILAVLHGRGRFLG